MKLISIIALFILTSCKGQNTKVQNTNFDTLKLFDPKPETKSDVYDEKEIFRNTISINDSSNVVVFNETQTFLKKGKEFETFINSKVKELKKKKLFIVHHDGIKFAEIYELIKLLKKNEIDNYKVIKLESFPLFEPLVDEETEKTTTETNLYTEKNFIIEMFKDSISLYLLGKYLTIKSQNQLDTFISRNKKKIDQVHIFIKGKNDLAYDRFVLVKSVLSKYEYYNYDFAIY